ncbi:MAG TPA: DNA integrity scanning diadenylate cyclase DisA [Acidimicrobiales bacterium]|nr:DNA integrity scanning diadenylate cyclase DisA [Acidimicrobiales bacterium]
MLDQARAEMIEALAAVAPGRPLRAGLDRVLQAGKGALIVVGDGPDVLDLCSGGFLVDAEFSPQRLHELAKMDGAIILADDASRIARANVHLVPSPDLPTVETGTRHRTAERVARAVDVPVIAVSEDMAVITVYRGASKRALDPVARLVQRANQALQTLERYRDRLDTVTASLSALEVEDLVTARDVVTVLQRAEMVRRIAEEVEGYVVELGTDGRLILLQLEELMGGVDDDRRHVIRDYLTDDDPGAAEGALRALASLSTDRLLDLAAVAAVLRLPAGADVEVGLAPRGYRLLSKLPRLPEHTVEAVVGRVGSLQKLLRATVAELEEVDGITPALARTVKEGLARLAESSILEGYG